MKPQSHKKHLLTGVAIAAISTGLMSLPAESDEVLDNVLRRLDKLEHENAALKAQVAKQAAHKKSDDSAPAKSTSAPAAASAAGSLATYAPSEAAQSLTIAPSAYQAPPLASNDGWFFHKKDGPALTFQTPGGEITAYGQFDMSADYTTKGGNLVITNPNAAGPVGGTPVGNFGWMPQISSNSSYVGVRGFQSVPDLGFDKPVRFVYQIETLIDFSANPGVSETNSNESNVVKGALASRNSYVGLASADWGALKIGKTDAPYKNSTDSFNPFKGQLGTYTAIMGNSGGDNRVEFETRLEHALWYESPDMHGLQFSALVSPGQNRSDINDNIASGSPDCTGGNIPGSGNPTANQQAPACTDGSFGTAYSVSGTYVNGGLTAVAAYERHTRVNRSSDIYGMSPGAGTSSGAIDPGTGLITAQGLYLASLDVVDEDAWKVGLQYKFPTKTTISAIFEDMHRYLPAILEFQNERSRNGTWLSVEQELSPKDRIAFGWAHAFATPGDIGQHNTAGGADPRNQADMVTGSYWHKFSPALTWYIDSAATFNGPDAHYDLGAGTHGLTTDCHDASNASGDPVYSSPHCWTGTTIIGVSTGLKYQF